jgi:hypothetical protein
VHVISQSPSYPQASSHSPLPCLPSAHLLLLPTTLSPALPPPPPIPLLPGQPCLQQELLYNQNPSNLGEAYTDMDVDDPHNSIPEYGPFLLILVRHQEDQRRDSGDNYNPGRILALLDQVPCQQSLQASLYQAQSNSPKALGPFQSI